MTSILHKILERSNHSPVTRDKYSRIIDQWITFAGSDPKSWTAATAQAFYDSMLDRGVSVRSANVTIASLAYVSKWYARQHGGVDFAVVQTKAAGKVKHGFGRVSSDDDEDSSIRPRRALTEAEARQLLGACSSTTLIGQRDWTMLVIGLETGMRRKSLEGCRFSNLKIGTFPTITVPIKGSGGDVTYQVPLSDTAFAAIKQWQTDLAAGDAVFPAFRRSLAGTGLQFTPVGPLSSSAIAKTIVGLGRSCSLQVHPHILRHTFVTWREMAGLNAVQIASITGHQALPVEYRNMDAYIDMAAIAASARNATPKWLAEYVAQHLRGR